MSYDTGQQPCDTFTPDEFTMTPLGHSVHQCPTCGGRRAFCSNCNRDHHDGGWEACWRKAKADAAREGTT